MCKKILLVIILITQFSCKQESEYMAINSETGTSWDQAHKFYENSLRHSIEFLAEVKSNGLKDPSNKELFRQARQEWKKAEPFAAYLNSPVGHRVNGPALPVFLEDNSRFMPAVGLQKIEESIYDGEATESEFQEELKVTLGLMGNLLKNIQKRELTTERFFIATQHQLLRILSHSITGFDTPVSHLGIEEAAISLEALRDIYTLTLQNDIRQKDKDLDQRFLRKLKISTGYLQQNSDFNTFDRYEFIREHLNDITSLWAQISNTSGLWEGTANQPFNFDAPTFFEENSFKPEYFMQTINRKNSETKIALGEKLFFEKKLSKNGCMACATCHLPGKAYADRLTFSRDNQGIALDRNTPTLINSIYQRGFFWDGRSEGLMEQISSVFTNKQEFDSGVHEFSEAILQDPTYQEFFEQAFGDIPKSNTELIKALSAYIATLNGMNSKFDRNISGKENTFTSQEKRGFNLFAGKALCATCHFLPLTNGTVPPFYTETEKEVIGVPETAENKKLDGDTGFYWSYNVEQHKGMFKTPGVRNIALTAPYMHNGVYKNLVQVIDFYNKGGGGGLGFDLPHQTLPFDNLELDDEEQAALVAYLKTLTDTQVTGPKKGSINLARYRYTRN
ncbi:cytochrome c peroxidase [Christiangramia portivictoriae]|uniref:cytochrome c peroxidase n=1 Tax=Christiangramia portivictoriae TaxID=326069 RepID=UPI000415E445|nr:cytochrome c peroxidase [Christiangramia portivictoriae]